MWRLMGHLPGVGSAVPSRAVLCCAQVGSYHIGKERAYLGAAHALGWRIHCPPAKRRLLRLLGLPQQWLDLVTPDAQQARIHVLGMGEQLHEQVGKGVGGGFAPWVQALGGWVDICLCARVDGNVRWERSACVRACGHYCSPCAPRGQRRGACVGQLSTGLHC